MEPILIPHSLQITMDDLGWFCGTDDREFGGPARSGMPRRHCAADYRAVNELGRRLNMKINCAFVLGEWDPDNRLRSLPNLSKYGENWDNAAYLDKEEAAGCVEVINGSEYIDMAVHGILHNCYYPGSDYGNTDYFYSLNGTFYPTPEDQVRKRLDAFFDLLAVHGFQKQINSFIPPSFRYRWDHLSRILKDYGILYVSTVFDNIKNHSGLSLADVENGIITVDRNFNEIPWYEVGSDPRSFEPVKGIFGCHWPNVLHAEPGNYDKVLDNWEAYFKKCRETYGIILSRDIAFAATQSLYKRFAETSLDGDVLTIDISRVPQAPGRGDSFYVSSRQPIVTYSGCQLALYEKQEGFFTYQVTPTASCCVLTAGNE